MVVSSENKVMVLELLEMCLATGICLSGSSTSRVQLTQIPWASSWAWRTPVECWVVFWHTHSPAPGGEGHGVEGEGVVGGPGVQTWWECGGDEDLEPFQTHHNDTGECCWAVATQAVSFWLCTDRNRGWWRFYLDIWERQSEAVICRRAWLGPGDLCEFIWLRRLVLTRAQHNQEPAAHQQKALFFRGNYFLVYGWTVAITTCSWTTEVDEGRLQEAARTSRQLRQRWWSAGCCWSKRLGSRSNVKSFRWSRWTHTRTEPTRTSLWFCSSMFVIFNVLR